jgi:hypothetical protein
VTKLLATHLVSTSTGLRKTIIQYQGIQGRCRTCKRNYAPTPIRHTKKSKVYGDKLGAWLVYQRVGLRLPYESIIELFAEQFKEHISISQPMRFLKQYAVYYRDTEQTMLHTMLQSRFCMSTKPRSISKGSTGMSGS